MRRVAGRVLVVLGRAFMVLGLRGADREFLMGDLEEELESRSTRTPGP